jgi:hypothetical protein
VFSYHAIKLNRIVFVHVSSGRVDRGFPSQLLGIYLADTAICQCSMFACDIKYLWICNRSPNLQRQFVANPAAGELPAGESKSPYKTTSFEYW